MDGGGSAAMGAEATLPGLLGKHAIVISPGTPATGNRISSERWAAIVLRLGASEVVFVDSNKVCWCWPRVVAARDVVLPYSHRCMNCRLPQADCNEVRARFDEERPALAVAVHAHKAGLAS